MSGPDSAGSVGEVDFSEAGLFGSVEQPEMRIAIVKAAMSSLVRIINFFSHPEGVWFHATGLNARRFSWQ